MIESDTIKLLRECDAGIKMGVKSIDNHLKYFQFFFVVLNGAFY